jgi:hypothetical protein
MMSGITEGVVEEACLEYLRACGYDTLFGPEIGPGGSAASVDCEMRLRA